MEELAGLILRVAEREVRQEAGTAIRERHLKRLAVACVRQSTPQQVLTNRESTRLQYGLRERERRWGWPEERIETIDEDQGDGLGGAAAAGLREAEGAWRTGWRSGFWRRLAWEGWKRCWL